MKTLLYTLLFFSIGVGLLGGLLFEALKHPQTANLVGAGLSGLIVVAIIGFFSWALGYVITHR
jgi:hypothetical protein